MANRCPRATSIAHRDWIRQAADGGYTRQTTHAGPRGTTTVEDRGSWDPTTRAWTRVKVVTRPDGSTEKTGVSTEVTPTP